MLLPKNDSRFGVVFSLIVLVESKHNHSILYKNCKKKPYAGAVCKICIFIITIINLKLILICMTTSDFPGGSDSKASAYNARDLGSVPGSGRSPGEGNGNPLQYSCLENPMDGGAW